MKQKSVKSITLLSIAISFGFFSCLPTQSQTGGNEKFIALVNNIITNTSFKFVDQNSRTKYSSTNNVPANAHLSIESVYNDWRYWNGVLNVAMIRLSETMNEPGYSNYAKKNIEFNFDNYEYFKNKYDGSNKWSYPYAQRFIMEELDDYGAMTAGLIEVYKYDPQKRYLDYINKAGDYILNHQHRYSDGSFIRSFPKQWTLWADDLYMSISFLSRMGDLTNDPRYFDDAVKQVINFHKHLLDEEKGLMYHNWYSINNSVGVAFWGRANGWAILAQIDLIDKLPLNHPQRETVISLFRKHISGIARYQSESGMWHQVLDKNDSYIETSCSAMFAYAMARGVNTGILDNDYLAKAKRSWQGILTKIDDKGNVEGVCTGTVVSDNLADYYNRPAPLNDVHGIGTVILAGVEIMRIKN